MVTVEQILDVSYKNGSRWVIYDGDNEVFAGWIWELEDRLLDERKQSTIYKKIKERQVKRFCFKLDIKHKQWNEKGLLAPLMPNETPDYEFSDLRTDLFYEVHI